MIKAEGQDEAAAFDQQQSEQYLHGPAVDGDHGDLHVEIHDASAGEQQVPVPGTAIDLALQQDPAAPSGSLTSPGPQHGDQDQNVDQGHDPIGADADADAASAQTSPPPPPPPHAQPQLIHTSSASHSGPKIVKRRAPKEPKQTTASTKVNVCDICQTTESKLWRRGAGDRLCCNACGLRYKRSVKSAARRAAGEGRVSKKRKLAQLAQQAQQQAVAAGASQGIQPQPQTQAQQHVQPQLVTASNPVVVATATSNSNSNGSNLVGMPPPYGMSGLTAHMHQHQPHQHQPQHHGAVHGPAGTLTVDPTSPGLADLKPASPIHQDEDQHANLDPMILLDSAAGDRQPGDDHDEGGAPHLTDSGSGVAQPLAAEHHDPALHSHGDVSAADMTSDAQLHMPSAHDLGPDAMLHQPLVDHHSGAADGMGDGADNHLVIGADTAAATDGVDAVPQELSLDDITTNQPEFDLNALKAYVRDEHDAEPA